MSSGAHDLDLVEEEDILKKGSKSGKVLASSQDMVPKLIPEAEGSSHARTPNVAGEHDV